MTSISQYHKLLPGPIISEKGRRNNFATSVRNVLFLTRTLPGYKDITYAKFVKDFPKFVKLTNFEDDPNLYISSGQNKGKLKEVNLTTLANTWVNRYNFNDDFKVFKTKVAYEAATEFLEDTVISNPSQKKKDDDILDRLCDLQNDILDDPEMPVKDKAYSNRACQDAKTGIVQSNNLRFEQGKDYKNIIDEYEKLENPEVDVPYVPVEDDPLHESEETREFWNDILWDLVDKRQ